MAVGKQSHFRERLGKEKPLMAGRGRESELHPRETWFELSWRERKCLLGGKKREYVLAKQRANSLRHLRQKGKYAVLRVLDYGLSLFHPALRLFFFFHPAIQPPSDTICLTWTALPIFSCPTFTFP